jgi:hypothetical protein
VKDTREDFRCINRSNRAWRATRRKRGQWRRRNGPSASDRRHEARGTAKLAIHSSANATLVIKDFGERFGDAAALALELSDGMNNIRKNDLSSCEAMLYSQAQALQAIFVDLSLRATKQQWFANGENALMRMTLAQSQCRATVETLAAIKNRPCCSHGKPTSRKARSR